MTKRKSAFIDFTEVGFVPGIISSTAGTIAAAAVVSSGADTTAEQFVINNNILEVYNTGATTVAGPTVAATGWTFPCASGAFGHQITFGALDQHRIRFRVGTDPAFFARAKFYLRTAINRQAGFGVGFREAGAYVVNGTVANMRTAYDEKFIVGTEDSGANWYVIKSLGGVDTQPVLTTPAAPMVIDTAYDVIVKVSAAGVTTATVNGVAIASAAAITQTFTTGDYLVPTIMIANDTSGAASAIELVEFQADYQTL